MGNPHGGASKTVQMTEEAYHRARVAAVLSQQTLGQWLEEAVAERVREGGGSRSPGLGWADLPRRPCNAGDAFGLTTRLLVALVDRSSLRCKPSPKPAS